MKPAESLLASALVAAVAGVVAALAVDAIQEPPARAEGEPRPPAASGEGGQASEETPHALDELRMEHAALARRLDALEARLAETSTTRTSVTLEARPGESSAEAVHASDDPLAAPPMPELTPEFVASVGQAMETIRAREDAEREKRRKELQALRIEERVTRLQQELGLNNRQASDLRTALIQQDDKRETLFASMRDEAGDPRDVREGFRQLRDDTLATIEGVLTPEQFRAFQESEEAEFGRRDFGGPPGGRSPDDPFGRRPGR